MRRIKNIHFIGIGGIGMSGIAQLVLGKGISVSGSDIKQSLILKELENKGAKIFIGHGKFNIPKNTNIVVYSSAIESCNPELKEAKKRKIKIFKRAQMLAELMKDKVVITVAGAHGKTTTASLASFLLLEAGLCPSVSVGGIIRNTGNNACFGNGKYFVAEADESDGSFLYYRPIYSIITNIDFEHIDFYKTWDNILNTFKRFAGCTNKKGYIIACGDDQNLRKILKSSKIKTLFFGFSKNCDCYAKNIKLNDFSCEFDCIFKNKNLGRFKLNIAGRHNILNSLSVIVLSQLLNIDIKKTKNILSRYKGASRRLEIKANLNNIMLLDDYGHHPTEIRATLDALSNLDVKRKIIIFQPHRYTRTKYLLDEFAKSFNQADRLIITDIYAASEVPISGINGELLCKKIQESGHPDAHFLSKDKIVDYLVKTIQPGDLVLTLGAGDISKVCDELAKRIKG